MNRQRRCVAANISEGLDVEDEDKEDIFSTFLLLKSKKLIK